MGNNENCGFSGLSGLASNIDKAPQNAESKNEVKDNAESLNTTSDNSFNKSNEKPTVEHHNSTDIQDNEKTTKKSESHTSNENRFQTDNSSNKSNFSSWVFWCFVIVGGLLIYNSISSNDSKPKYQQNSTNTKSPAYQAPAPEKPFYARPTGGYNQILSVNEIRWCIRSTIQIDAMRGVFKTNQGIDKFNDIVADHNNRCGNYRYRRGAQGEAQRDVEKFRYEIEADAREYARQLDGQNKKRKKR